MERLLREALARGYCSPENEKKELDATLIEAMVKEAVKALTSPDTQQAQQEYSLKISPALVPKERHEIEKVLQTLKYHVIGGGTCTDMSNCDISFEK